MRKLIVAGVPPIEAAAAARADQGSVKGRKNKRSESDRSALATSDDRELVEQLYRAAKSLDREILEAGLLRHFEANGVESTWQRVMCPLLNKAGDEWKRSGNGIEIEHMLSDLIARILFTKVRPTNHPLNPRPVLIASIGEETHSLAITALAAALAERNISFQFLGARTPQAALNEVVRRSAPPAIFMWAQLKKHADHSYITELPALRPKAKVIVGGPGWSGLEPVGAEMATDLTSACAAIERALGL
jgi:hypothetical protein